MTTQAARFRIGQPECLAQEVVVTVEGYFRPIGAQAGRKTAPVTGRGGGNSGVGPGSRIKQPDFGLAIRNALAQEVVVTVEGYFRPIGAQAGVMTGSKKGPGGDPGHGHRGRVV